MSALNLDALGLQPDPEGQASAAPAAPEVTPATPATPAAPAPVEPEPDEEIDIPDGAQNPDAVKTLIQAERAAARQAYKRARDAEAQLAAITEASMPVEQRLTAAQARAEEATLEATRLRVGMKHGLPLTFAEMLRGNDEQTLETNAKAVLQELQSRGAATPTIPGLTLGGGAQTAPPATEPGQAHNNFLLGLIGGRRPGA